MNKSQAILRLQVNFKTQVFFKLAWFNACVCSFGKGNGSENSKRALRANNALLLNIKYLAGYF